MYPKQQASVLTQQFWTIFGKYMAPVLSAGSEKINWVNYKTGIKFIRFNMQAGNNFVIIAIELFNPDIVLQQQQFNELLKFKKQFEQICGDTWLWQKAVSDQQGKIISQVIDSIKNVNILNQSDWPEIISFLKLHIIALDDFWSNYKFVWE